MMIRVMDVTHHYGIRPVLKGVSIEIPTGDVVALMGPNGSGKSTLMQVMAGVIAPFKGHVEVDGVRRRRTAEEEIALRKKTVYLPAEAFVPRSITGREWLLSVGRIYRIEEDRLMDHCDRLLGLFELEKQGDSVIQAYSTGQQKKIALAAALVTEAPIMLLDEPFSGGLDPSGILALRKVLQHMAKQDNITIVMATPVPELVEEIADRVAVLRSGQVVAYDRIGALKQQTGASRLDEVYQKLVDPEGGAKADAYFREVRP